MNEQLHPDTHIDKDLLRVDDRFLQVAIVILAIITGALLALPWGYSIINIIIGSAVGLLIGMRRRHSRFFLYFLMAAVLVLSTTLLNNAINQ